MSNRPCCVQRKLPWAPKERSAQQGGASFHKSDTFQSFTVQSLHTKAFLSNTLHPCSVSSRSWRKKALAWQLHTGGLCFSLGEEEQVVQCILSHWSLVQTYFKACGSQQGSYVSLLIFTSIWSTLSKSTQWDLCRVINIPQLSGLPLPCSKSSYHSLVISDTPGYCVLLFLRLQFPPPVCTEKGKIQSFAWTLTHLFIKLILLSMFTLGSELLDRWLKERISSEQGIAPLKSHGNLVLVVPFQHGCYHRFSSCQCHTVPTPHMAKPDVFVEGSRMDPVPGCPGVCSNLSIVFSEMRRKLCVLIIPGAKHKV